MLLQLDGPNRPDAVERMMQPAQEAEEAWFLGGPSEVTYSFDGQLRHASREVFIEQLAEVWRNVAQACVDGARVIVRFGGIRDRRQEPRELLRESIKEADCGWRLLTARSAGLATAGRRQAKQFKRRLTAPIEEYDFHARLCAD